MKRMDTQDLQNIYGGGINFSIVALIGAGITFLIGVIDGYIRPLACNR